MRYSVPIAIPGVLECFLRLLGSRLPIFGVSLLAAVLSSSLKAQTFQPVPALSFTKPFGGADPLPQIVTVASTGSVISFTPSVSTTSGGNWLSVFVPCCNGATPKAATVTVNPGVALAAGSYGGHVSFTAGALSLVIPVTLVIAPPGGTFFDVVQGQMSFSMNTSGGSPPAQLVQIRNGGAGTLNWNLTATTADGGNWLSVSGASGVAPSIVSVGVQRLNLPNAGLVAGVFVGHLVFQSASSSVTIPVSVVVGDSVLSQINGISFTKAFGGGDPLPQTLTIASTGSVLSFTAEASTGKGGNWLSVFVPCCNGTTPKAATVTVTTGAAMAAGIYTGQVVFNTGGSAITVPVTLTVAASGSFFDSVPGQMSFSFALGSGAPPAQLVQVRNGGAGSLNWNLTATTSDGGNWLNVSAPGGIAPAIVSVNITPTSLPNGGLIAGTFTGQLLFQTDGNSATIPVSVVVSDSVIRQMNGISFSKPFGGADPLPQTVVIASTASVLSFTAEASTAKGGNWLSVFVPCCNGATPKAATVTVTTSPTLAVGAYSGQVVFNTGGSAITVPVTLTVSASGPFFDNVPGQMSFSMKTGGNAPPSQLVQIRNASTGTLNWSLAATTSDGGNWLSVSAPSGVAPSIVSVSILPPNLPNGGLIAGSFTGQLLFQTDGSSVTVPVSVVVGDSVLSQLNGVSFTKPFGGANPLPQTLTIASTGSVLSFTTDVSTATGGNWLSVFVPCCNGTTPKAATVTVNASPVLAAGVYTGQVVFNTGGTAITVPVTLTVAASGAFFDNLQGQMSFSFAPGSGAPPPQSVQIRNGGTGTLNWTLAPTTSDGGNWLSASAVSGTSGSSTVNVSVLPSALPSGGLAPGLFTGQLLIQTAGDSVTIPVSVQVGADVFNQLPGMTFTKPFGAGNPLPQTLNVTSIGAVLSFTAAALSANGGNWLSVFVPCCNGTTPKAAEVTVNSSAVLAAGTYTGQVVFNKGDAAMTVPVLLTVTGGCTFTLSPPSANVLSDSGTGTILVTASLPSCAWTAVSSAAFLTITSGASSTGNGTIGFSVAANTGAQRTATITAGGQTFTFTQEPPCTFTLSATGASFPSGGGPGSVNITASSGGCSWTAVSNAPWITVTSGASGAGSGTVGYSVAANNTGVARSGAITITGQTFNITQQGPICVVVNNTLFVKRMFLDFLGRPADPGGLAFWTNLLDTCAQTRAQVAISFFNSPEFKLVGLYITNAYTAILNRDPDYGGWNFWFGEVRNGQPKISVVNSFITSAEFVLTYGSLNNTQFVNLVYQNVYGRQADPGGLTFWVAQLNAGLTRAQMMDAFMTAPEYEIRLRTRQLSNLCYLGFLARTPEAAGRTFWTGALDGGLSEADLVNNFITSAEYQLRLAATQ